MKVQLTIVPLLIVVIIVVGCSKTKKKSDYSRGWRARLSKQLASCNTEDPAADVRKALTKGDRRFWHTSGLHVSHPGGAESKGYTFSGSNEHGDVAWYRENCDKARCPIGRKEANELGLYDMSGNIWEWCQDWWGNYPSGPEIDPVGTLSGSTRVVRGGSYMGYAFDCRTTERNQSKPSGKDARLGFRIVCSVADLEPPHNNSQDVPDQPQ